MLLTTDCVVSDVVPDDPTFGYTPEWAAATREDPGGNDIPMHANLVCRHCFLQTCPVNGRYRPSSVTEGKQQMKRTFVTGLLTTAAVVSSVLMAPASIAQTPAAAGKEWSDAGRQPQRPALLHPRPDHQRKRPQAPGRLDLLHRRAARPRRRAAGRRRRHVRARAVPQHGLRARPQQRRQDPLEVRAEQDPNVIPVMCCDTVNRGVAYGDGKIFLHQADTTLVALDAKTGNVVWSVKTDDPAKGATGTDAPLVVKDKVLCRRLRRRVRRARLARRLQHRGRQAGLARLLDGTGQRHADPARQDHQPRQDRRRQLQRSKSWQGDQWKIGGGATWGWKSYDPQTNTIFYGSGNPSTWNPKQRPGDNKYSMTDLGARCRHRRGEVALPDDAARPVGL